MSWARQRNLNLKIQYGRTFLLTYLHIFRIIVFVAQGSANDFSSWAYSSAVEHPAHNRTVPGSIPGGPTKLEIRGRMSEVRIFQTSDF